MGVQPKPCSERYFNLQPAWQNAEVSDSPPAGAAASILVFQVGGIVIGPNNPRCVFRAIEDDRAGLARPDAKLRGSVVESELDLLDIRRPIQFAGKRQVGAFVHHQTAYERCIPSKANWGRRRLLSPP